MKKILLLFVLAIAVSSCAKKAVVAAFAPSPVASETSVLSVSEGVNQRIVHEPTPVKNTNQPAAHHVPQNSKDASLLKVASSVAPTAQQESAALHIDRILDSAPVKSDIQKASLKKLKAAPRGVGNWAPQLKIGLTLLAIGILLAVFGLGFVGGLAALIGLLFTIIGLLVTY